MATTSSSSSYFPFTTTFPFTYDAFLSFRGEDTRSGFTGYLYYSLTNRGIKTFIDDEELGRGKEIASSLFTAIEQSRAAVVVLSKNYASSSFCLDELVKILECVKGKGRLIIPVFYDVDPSHVRKQTGTYGEALAVHEANNVERLKRWKMALEKIADLSGYHFKHGDGYEHKFVAKIVGHVSIEIKRATLPIVDHPVGLDSQVENVISLLNVGSSDGVCVLGIHGIGGIGKTTLAVAVYNWLVNHFAVLCFENMCFHENTRENSNKYGLKHLQKTLLFELVGENKVALMSVREGISMLKQKLQRKKILLILDDIDQQEQLDALAGNLDWFSPGSRVIITTRDTSLLSRYEDRITYELDKLTDEDSLELLSFKALKINKVDPSYLDILSSVVTYASGLPLALEVMGSNFLGKSIEQWKSALDQYRRIPNKKIQNVLKVSFDGLEEFEKEIFLDIACCFNGCELKDVKRILCAHHNVDTLEYGLKVLVEKSLIKMDAYRGIILHALIQDMGREIVRQESPKKPGKRSRLWLLEDIVQVFEMNMGSDKIEMIHMDFPKFEKVIRWDGEAFKKMRNLKTLFIRHTYFSQGPKYLPNCLRVLNWEEYPSPCLPLDFHPEGLVIFQLSGKSIQSVRFLEKQKYMSLTVINLDHSNVEEIPDISGVPNLVNLSLNMCLNLIKIHESIVFLDRLSILSAQGCRRLKRFPSIKLTNLVHLCLSGCSSLEHFPKMLGKLKNILTIYSDGTLIKELPSAIKRFCLISHSSMIKHGASSPPALSSPIVMSPDEEKVTSERSEVDVEEEQGSPMAPLEAKHSACKLPDLLHESFTTYLTWFRNVEDLDLSEHNFTVLDESLKELCSLRSLSLNGCRELREIKGIPPNIKYFSARNCISLTYPSKNMLLNKELHEDGAKDFVLPSSSIPKWVEHSSNNDSISFWFHNKLPEISLCVLVGPAVDFSRTHICPEFIINSSRGQAEHLESVETSNQLVDHIFITDPKLMKSKVNEVILENEWNHVVCTIKSCGQRGPAIKKLGIYFHKDRSSMANIQFIDPLLHKEELIMGNFQVNMQQQKYMASHERRLSLDLPLGMSFSLNDHVSREPNSSVQGPCVDDLCTLRLGLDYIDLPCHASSERDNGSGSTLLSLASNDTANDRESNDDLWMYSKELSLRQCWQEPLDSHLRSNLMQLTSTRYNIRDEETAQAVLDHPANILAEYSQSPFLAETQNLQAPLFPSSLSGMAIREEFHHKTCCTVLPTTTDDDADDLEMEGFYASLDAETNVIPFSPNEETMEALKIALDFITNNNDASVFLDAQHCSIMKTSLDYLSSLSANDGLSGAMRALISEASTVFAHCSSSYIEANMKVESTASELLRADNLKSDLENNKNQFNDTVASEKELRQKLARLEEMKEELEKQIRTTNANIMASRKEQNTTRKRKRDVYVEGKALKAQMDVMNEKVPRLQHEHDLAKENQEKIKAEWSDFGEKFKKDCCKVSCTRLPRGVWFCP
ncbi:TMV resistance protein N-like isoform X1 [Arachis ipaensis]|uniref:TMV resistance protein N-like isoform X1 n=1 Tax=Arachis ipaensis TaxID=130454 RepID=UPI000A2B5E9F|nr:TMV resistance protein N-like isoform X1 [Arachis ipaensis]